LRERARERKNEREKQSDRVSEREKDRNQESKADRASERERERERETHESNAECPFPQPGALQQSKNGNENSERFYKLIRPYEGMSRMSLPSAVANSGYKFSFYMDNV